MFYGRLFGGQGGTRRGLWRLLTLVTFVALVAAACGSDDDATTANGADSADDTADFDEAQIRSADDGGDVETAENDPESAPSAQAPDDGFDGDALGSGGNAQGLDPTELGREIIFTANLEVGVDDVAAAGTQATEVISGIGGFVFGQNSTGGAEPRNEITFKVRPEDFSEALNALGGIGELRNQVITTDDVTERVVDLNSRITVEELGVQRLRERLEATTTLEDFAEIERLLLERESTLELMRGQLRTLRDRIDLATITMVLVQDRLENAIRLAVSAYEGHDGGARCPGEDLNQRSFDPGDDVTLCFDNRNDGDQTLTNLQISESVLEINNSAGLISVFGDPDELTPGQRSIQAFEFEVERDLFLRAVVVATPTDGTSDEAAGPLVRNQASPQLTVDESAAPPGFGDGFDGGISLIRGVWIATKVVVGFLIPLLVLVPFLLASIWLWRKLRARRLERWAASQPPPPASPSAGTETTPGSWREPSYAAAEEAVDEQ